MMKPSDCAWIALGMGILAWEALCPPGELLSQAADRYRTTRPVVTHAVVGYIALHLLRQWPRQADPLHWLAEVLKK